MLALIRNKILHAWRQTAEIMTIFSDIYWCYESESRMQEYTVDVNGKEIERDQLNSRVKVSADVKKLKFKNRIKSLNWIRSFWNRDNAYVRRMCLCKVSQNIAIVAELNFYRERVSRENF